MTTYQHRFESVEGYLHHRQPYLLVERIIAIEPAAIVTEKMISGDEFYVQGHFPGAPIMPGAMMQELTTQSAGVLIAANFNPMQEYYTDDPTFNEFALGVLVKVKRARYKGFARPGDTLTVRVDLREQVNSMFDFSATIKIDDSIIMKNAFQLTNIKSSILTDTRSSDRQ